ncbi:MAG TPA: tail fiber domain-containing protein [Vicinamibacteria bacterium]|nr:tail fiber domain-containing protein [Vicinamibacteria bacterium]
MSGDLGVGTDVPAMKIHASSNDTPTLRLEQDGTTFEPQTYDVGSWEFGFFIDDITSSTTPFEIDAGAPSGSVFVAGGSGDVGFGTTSPGAPVHILRGTGEPNIRLETLDMAGVRFEMTNSNGEWEFIHGPLGGFNFNRVGHAGNEFIFSTTGNLVIQGSLSQGSSRSIKKDFSPIDSREILSKVAELPLSTWTYKTDKARHVGPMAEDFRSVFGLGIDEKHLAPGDLAGVALAAIQGLNETVTELNATLKEKDERITALEQEMAELRALLADLTSAGH